MSLLGAIEGLGTKRIFGIYLGINQNLSKLSIILEQLLTKSIHVTKSLFILYKTN